MGPLTNIQTVIETICFILILTPILQCICFFLSPGPSWVSFSREYISSIPLGMAGGRLPGCVCWEESENLTVPYICFHSILPILALSLPHLQKHLVPLSPEAFQSFARKLVSIFPVPFSLHWAAASSTLRSQLPPPSVLHLKCVALSCLLLSPLLFPFPGGLALSQVHSSQLNRALEGRRDKSLGSICSDQWDS